jgi:hypothetical protein
MGYFLSNFCPQIQSIMKHRALLIIFFIACMTLYSYGQAVRDKSNMLIGKIESDGYLLG